MRSFTIANAPWATHAPSGSMGPPDLAVCRSLDATSGGGALSYESRFVLHMDILFLIFMECDIRTLVTCRLVCKNFDAFIKNQRTLLYKLALALERQMDSSWNGASFPPLTSLQKLQRLRRQSLAWRGELPSALKLEIPVTRPDSIYELNGGIFALGDTHSGGAVGGVVAFPGMSLPDGVQGARLDFVKLPSVIAGNLGVEWGHISLGRGIQVVDFTMDVDMDLLVLIEKKQMDSEKVQYAYRVHLMSLSRSIIELEPHPMAHSAVLEHPCHPDWSEYQIEFLIYGDHVGLLMNSAQSATSDRLVVWNWKNGMKAVKYASEEILETFVFLREGLVLVPSYTTASLDILSYTPSREVGTFQSIISFLLPAPNIGLDYLYILVRSQPTGRSNESKWENPMDKLNQILVPPSNEAGRQTTNARGTLPDAPGPLDSASVPFSPLIDDAIIVASTRVAPVAGQLGDSWADRVLPDCEGTLVIKKSTLWKRIHVWEEEMESIFHDIELGLTPPWMDPTDELTGFDITDAESPDTPLHRSQGVQTSPEPQPPSGRSPMVVHWGDWMGETRWLRDKEAPRWVRDVHGMRFATRVRDVAPALLPSYSYPDPPAGAYQSGAIGSLPTMQQLWNAPAVDSSSDISPPNSPQIPPLATVTAPVQIPSFSGLFHQQHDPTTTPLPPMPPPAPQPNTIVDEVPRYRTRICDFNQKPYVRVPNAVPYPGHIQLDLSIDYGNLAANDEVTETLSGSLPEDQAHVKRNKRYIRKKRRMDGGLTSDRGWSVIRLEKGLEWTRRPVWDWTIIQPGVTYAERICTGMPYLEITSNVFNDCTSLMMDAERIIGMKTDDALNLTSLEVLVI